MLVLSAIALAYFTREHLHAAPPFSGTIFLDPDIIVDSDPTTFQSVVAAGLGNRWMFDRRVNNWVHLNAFLFKASYSDGLGIEIQVNSEFGDQASAWAEASKYAPIIGRLPTCLRVSVQTVWIHKGTQPFGGGNNNLLIHTGQADQYEESGILEETLVHEATHTSLDAVHVSAPRWIAAQIADGEFISTYARDYPDREDLAETFLLYLAFWHRSERISLSLSNTISQTIPNRIAYLHGLNLDMNPVVPPPSPTPAPMDLSTLQGAFIGNCYAQDSSDRLSQIGQVSVLLGKKGVFTGSVILEAKRIGICGQFDSDGGAILNLQSPSGAPFKINLLL